jgi:hypothetical protein
MAGALISLAALSHETGEREQEQRYLSEATNAAGAAPVFSMAHLLARRRAELLVAESDRSGARVLVMDRLASILGKAVSARLHNYPLLLLLAELDLSEPLRAARLLGAAAGVAARLGLVAPDRADRERAARLRAALTEQLQSATFTEAEVTGAALDDEGALALALASRPGITGR